MSWESVIKRERPTRKVEDLSMGDYLRVNSNISRDLNSLWGTITRYWSGIGKVKGSMDGNQILDLIKGNSRNPNIVGAFNWADPALRFGTNAGESYHAEISRPTAGNIFGRAGANFNRVPDNPLFRPNMPYQEWVNAAPILYVEYRGINIPIYLTQVISLFSMLDRLTIQKGDMFDDIDLSVSNADTPLSAENLQWMTYDQVRRITEFDINNTIDIDPNMRRDSISKLRKNKEDLKYLKIDNLIIAATKDYKIPEGPRPSRILEYALGTIHMDSTARANDNLTKEFIIYLDDEHGNSEYVERMGENIVEQKLHEYRLEMQNGPQPEDANVNVIGEYNLKSMVRFLSGRKKRNFREYETGFEGPSISELEPINQENLTTIKGIIDSERAKKFRRFRTLFTDDLSDAVDNFWHSINRYNQSEKERGGQNYLTLTPEHYKNYFHGYDVEGYLENLPPDFVAYLKRGSTAEVDSSKLKLFSAEYKLVMNIDVEEDYLKEIPHTISNLNASYHFRVTAENKNYTPKANYGKERKVTLYYEEYGPMGNKANSQSTSAEDFRRHLKQLIPEKWNIGSTYARKYFQGYDSPQEARGHTMLMASMEQSNFTYSDGYSFLSTEYIPRIERHVLRIDFRWVHYLGRFEHSGIRYSNYLARIFALITDRTVEPHVYTIRRKVFYGDVFSPQSMGLRTLSQGERDGYRTEEADMSTDWKSCIYPSKEILIGVAEGRTQQADAQNMVCIHMQGMPKGDLIATQFLVLGNYVRMVDNLIKEVKNSNTLNVKNYLDPEFSGLIERVGGEERLESILNKYPLASDVNMSDINNMMSMVSRVAEVERFYDLAVQRQHSPRIPDKRFILTEAPQPVPRGMGGRY